MRTGRAWAVLVSALGAYELLCPDGQLLTDGVDAACAKHPALRGVIAVGVVGTAAHLLGYRGRLDLFRALGALRGVVRLI